MKKYSQFLKELPSKTVVFAFGRFNPPTTGHELLVKAVKKLAATNKADHAIYASKSQDAKKNPLTVEKKVHYLQLMFPGTNFVAANPNERTFIEAAKALNKKYKNLIMVAGSDRIPEYERILNTYNGKEFHYDTVQVISAGERDPDADDATGMSASKMRAVATKGDYSQFKKGLPSTMREIDGRRLMNDVRQGMGLEPIKEQLNLVKDELREKYFRGEIFNIGDLVECAGTQYEIVKRGSNHLLLKEQSGKLVSKWIQDVTLLEDVAQGYAPQEITFGGYTTKNLHHSEDAAKAFLDTIARHGKDKPASVLHALMATDTYMGLSDLHLNQGKVPTETEKDQWIKSHEHAQEHLEELGEFLHHRDYWDNHQHEMEDLLSQYKEEGKEEMRDSVELEGTMIPEELTDKTLKSQDKIKVARIIATMLGVDNAESSANSEMLVNTALRKIRTKALNPESLKILNKMLALADEVGIKYDASLKPTKLKEETLDETEKVDPDSEYNLAKDRLRYKDFVKLKRMNGEDNHTKPGHSTLAPYHDDSDRRQRVMYQTEAVKEPTGDLKDACWKGYTAVGMKMKNGKKVPNCVPVKEETDEQEADALVKNTTGSCPLCGKDECECDDAQGARRDRSLSKPFDPFFKEQAIDMSNYEDGWDDQSMTEDEPSDEELDHYMSSLSDDELYDLYDDEELAIVDDESGEELEADEDEEEKLEESTLMEVLSRLERMKAKARMRRTKAKRERATKIALKRYSGTATINKRARRLAIKLMKKRLLRGRDPAKISVGEKERVERVIERRKKVIGRIAMRLAPRVRKIEKARMSHQKFTAPAPAVGM